MQTQMPCLDENLVDALVEGALPPADAAAARDHLGACAACRELVEGVALAAGRSLTALAPTARPPTPGGRASGDPLVGQTLADTYRVLHPVGSGGMGTVYAAEHLRLGRKVAVKVLAEPLRAHEAAFDRFRREAQTCGGLGSRHIVDVIDFNETADGTPFLVMELLEGEDLAQRLCLDGPLTPALALAIGRQICLALAAAHDEGILHRDLKPSNIFLCRGEDPAAPYVKVLDFGIAKARGAVATLTASQEVLGTPFYMSPEMASAQHELLDARSDLFSLGCILYEALCGRRPFDDESIPAVLYRVVHEDPVPLGELRPGIPEPLAALVMQLLSKKRDARPPAARVVAAALGQLAGAAPAGRGAQALTGGWRLSRSGRLLRPRARRALWLGLGSAALFAAAAAVAFVALLARSGPGPGDVPRPSPRAAGAAAVARGRDAPPSPAVRRGAGDVGPAGAAADGGASPRPDAARAPAAPRPSAGPGKGRRGLPPDNDPIL